MRKLTLSHITKKPTPPLPPPPIKREIATVGEFEQLKPYVGAAKLLEIPITIEIVNIGTEDRKIFVYRIRR